ncbi:lysophospholipase L1-like esterase [Tumebacillus sp. BK434]|uniref:GDSL-type esterase/lipase family protein n=1 Tax=Tumebacillus sp. BK434 TaxID=2512169 RepID=UPI0010441757|nr:GDSL-type esterase/lipase family protein [Tumebacillus sp. BK434]TCP59438.1 lysophospholipase L1-like esterase [Tumebacillus sp. BK434]
MASRLFLLFLLSLLVCFHPVQKALAADLTPLPKHLNYVAIGDSVTAGWGTPAIAGTRVNGYVAHLHRQMQVRGQATLHNFGIPGLTSGQFLFLLDHWPEASQHLQRADLITLSIGGNDIIWTEHQKPGDVMAMREALTKYQTNIRTILALFRQLNVDTRLFVLEVYNPFPEKDPRHTQLSEWITWVNESILAAAKAYDADVVPVASLFLGHEKEYVNLANNDIHPNAKGHALIAETISQALFGSFIPLPVAAEMKPNLLWNGERRPLRSDLVLENDTVYASLPLIRELPGTGRPSIRSRIGSVFARVNGKRIALPSPVFLKDGLPYLPLRPVIETVGARVYWVPDSRTISVFSK